MCFICIELDFYFAADEQADQTLEEEKETEKEAEDEEQPKTPEPGTVKIVNEYDQEIPQSQTADKPMALRGRATQQ